MLFKNEFYQEADKLHAELLALRSKRPSLFLYRWSDGRIRGVNLWFIRLALSDAAAAVANCGLAMTSAGASIGRFAQAMDRK